MTSYANANLRQIVDEATPMRKFLFALITGLSCLIPAYATEKPLWELGFGIGYIDFPDYRGSDERTSYFLPVPYFIYRGDVIKVDRESVRGRLFKSDRMELDISLNGSVPVDSDNNRARRGMPDLDPTLQLGPVLKIRWLEDPGGKYQLDLRLPLRAVISSEIEHVGWVAQPQLNLDIRDPFDQPGWKLGLLTGPIFGDTDYHDYFYGVEPRFARPGRPAYSAKGGYAGAQVIAALSKRFPDYWIGGFIKWDTLDKAVFDDSPLVRDKAHFTAGLAVSWIFRVSEEMVEVDIDRDPG